MSRFRLVRPDARYKESCLQAIAELRFENSGAIEWYYNLGDDFEIYVEDLLNRTTLRTEQIVPETVFWGILNGQFAGRISVRHELTEHLARIGGHIGYEVRPKFRKLGLGTEMLKLVLPEARKLGLSRVLLTCDDTNLGSIKIIEKNGGIYSQAVDQGSKKPKKLHYWITL